MAILNPKTAANRTTVTRFGGICDHAGTTPDAAYDMRNFRILSDGSLEKRCGYIKRYAFSNALRGLWEGTVSGESYLFAVASNQVYVRAPGATTPSAIYVLTTSEGEVSFFLYHDQLYLMDGKSLLRFRPGNNTFTVAAGYVPLYGYNWHPTELGEINEPLNLVRNDIRIHYFNSNGSTTFNLPFTTDKIRRVEINGTAITNYSFTSGTSSFTIPSSYATVGSVEVYVTLDPIFSGRASVLQACCAEIFRTPQREVAMFFGAKAGYLVYRTAPVSDEMMHDCSLTVADADPFYIAKDTAFAVGSSSHPITALCQFEDQMLVMNDESIWAIRYPDKDSNDAEIFPIRAGLGCASRRGAILGGKYPIVATSAGIARLKFSASDPDYCQTEILSANIRRRMNAEFLKSAVLFWEESRQELWVRNPNDTENSVWICKPDEDTWFRFDDIQARFFFRFDGMIGFADWDGVCYFEESLETDNGIPFLAEYESHFITFPHLHPPMRSLRVSIVAKVDTTGLAARIHTERTSKLFYLRDSQPSISPVCYDRRLALGRFRLLQYTITSPGRGRCRVHSISIASNH